MNSPSFTVREAMQENVISVLADMPLTRAVEVFLRHRISGAPVLDPEQRVIGMLTERDCINVLVHSRYFNEPADTVSHYMSKSVHSVPPDMSLMDVAELFMSSPFRRYPVVENEQLVGIISRRDVLKALISAD